MAYDIGDSLNPYHGKLKVLSARTETDLENQLNAIRMPFKILYMYAGNSRHFAWITGDHRLAKKKKTSKKKGITNG